MSEKISLKTSNNTEWETPQELFDEINAEFNLELDVCASLTNAKCQRFYTKEYNGLDMVWNGRVWCNPPYSEWGRWVGKGFNEVRVGRCPIAVFLLPARTDTIAFHRYIYNKPNVEIRFLKGRVKFQGAKNSAPFPSMVVIMKKL